MYDFQRFEDAWKYIQDSPLENLLKASFSGYLESIAISNSGDLPLDEMMNLFDQRKYKEYSANSRFFYDSILDLKQNLDRYRQLHHKLEDDLSRTTLLAMITARLTLNTQPLQSVHQRKGSEYFDRSLFTFSDQEVYVDCGAYKADTALEFMLASRRYKKLHLFEASPSVADVARKIIAGFKDENIILHEAAVGAQEKTVSFCENTGNGNGSINQQGDVTVRQITIDQTIQDAVTFIKMDIEGAEVDALLGAKETIRRNLPKLAICVYHKPDHVWRIWELVLQMRPEYRVYLRHFGGSAYFDTIMFFVPARDRLIPENPSHYPLKNEHLLEYCRILNEDQMLFESNQSEFVVWLQHYVMQLINSEKNANGLIAALTEQNEQSVVRSAGLLEEKNQAEDRIAGLLEEKNQAEDRITGLLEEKNQAEDRITGLVEETRRLISSAGEMTRLLSFVKKETSKLMYANEAVIDDALSSVEMIRASKSYRLTRALRITKGAIKKPAHYPAFAIACGARLFGRHERMQRFAPAVEPLNIIAGKFLEIRYNMRSCIGQNAGMDENSASSICLDTEATEITELRIQIAAAKAEGRRVICIFAPIFNSQNIQDGYYRRIKAIDDLMGKDTLRIYMSWMNCDYEHGITHIIKHDNYHYEYSYVNENDRQSRLVLSIAKEADLVYHHSVGFSNELVTRSRRIRKIFDLHGALPEELVMYGNFLQAQKDSRNEELAVEFGHTLVGVTNAMAAHIYQKYPDRYPRFIILPIFDEIVLNSRIELSERPCLNEASVVVYSGGMQKWQMIHQMIEAIRVAGNRLKFRVFTPHPKEFWEIWGDKARPQNLLVSSRTPRELMEEYKRCHYGFLLREDIPVNHVACPTKLVEYLIHGVVPILNTLHVGDFVADGMKYISYADFVAGNLPSEEERLQMARANQKIIDIMMARYDCGCEEIQRLFNARGDKK